MALFGWVFLLLIPVALLLTALTWAAAHAALVNGIAAALLALNLALLVLLLRRRAGRRREGRPPDRWTLPAVLWEGWVVLLCALFLLIRPLRFVPEDFGQPPARTCLGEWEITAWRGETARTGDELERVLGTRLVYGEDTFTSGGVTWALDSAQPYESSTVWRESHIIIPGTLVNRSFEELGIQGRKVPLVLVNLWGDAGETAPGQRIYLLDRDTLLTYWEGTFYQARRVTD